MMIRRDFLKLTASTLIVPTITLRRTIDRERLMMAFCEDESYKFDLTRPFLHNDKAHATDQYGMVRCDLELPTTGESTRKLPANIDEVWNQFFQPTRWRDVALPDVRNLRHRSDVGDSCPLCRGRRISLGEYYPEDDWLTSREAVERGYDVDDNSVYDESCEICHGREWNGCSLVMIEGLAIHYSFMKRIQSLPNARVSASKQGEALCFEADGFDGVQLPVDINCVRMERERDRR